jgi:Zinc finger, C2H2 type
MAPPSSTVSPAMASPPNDWPHQQAPQPPAYSASQPPDIFSAAFDPFSGFTTANNAGMVGTHSPEAPGLEFCQTPPSSNLASHRGSVSSYSPSDTGSNGAYTPRAKPEETGGEWYQAQSQELQRGLPAVSGPYGPAPTMASQTEQLYREPSNEALYRPQHEFAAEMPGDKLAARFDGMPTSMQPVLPSATRVRKRRQRTTPEEATHECRVCGKLFKRSYNWKSHMETHNPDRKYPHPCPHMVGSSPCTKKFQRKTDLDRHVDSVSKGSTRIGR